MHIYNYIQYIPVFLLYIYDNIVRVSDIEIRGFYSCLFVPLSSNVNAYNALGYVSSRNLCMFCVEIC